MRRDKRMNWAKRDVFPFPAILGQDSLKRALLANAVCPEVGGVLVRGEKGTAKSTAVRALAALLPEIDVSAGCPYGCDPGDVLCPACAGRADETERRRVRMVDLPVGATEDRVVGTMHFEQAVREGRRSFEPGLLAAAHRGILYVDEVNLLPDHLADVILDAAASGVNVVEREGVSVVHPARFLLVGTMNPEEGEVRPQLLDRFGLCVEVRGLADLDARVELMRRRRLFEDDAASFATRWKEETARLKGRVTEARRQLKKVSMPAPMRELCARLALEACADGQRGDIAVYRAAIALAALDGADEAEREHVEEAAGMALAHRRKSPPPPPSQEQPSQPPADDAPAEPDAHTDAQAQPQQAPTPPQDAPPPESPDQRESPRSSPPLEQVFSSGQPFAVRDLPQHRDHVPRSGSGKRSRTRTPSRAGRYVFSTMNRGRKDLALDATLRAAAPYQGIREKNGMALVIRDQDIREKVREKRIGNFIVFAVDASGSMGAQKRMVETKGAVLSLLLDAYVKRDKVCLVAFRGEGAEVLLPPTGSIEQAYRLLEELPTGGKTPLAHGLEQSCRIIENQLLRDRRTIPLLVLVSDGRANVPLNGGKPLDEAMELARGCAQDDRFQRVVVDVERDGFVRFGLAEKLAAQMQAAHFRIEDLKAEALASLVRGLVNT